MFEDSLVESAALLRTHNRWPALLSLAAQLIAAAVVLSIPLLHPESLPLARSLPATLAPPRPPAPPPPVVRLKPRPANTLPSAPATAAPPARPLFPHLPSTPAVDAPTVTTLNLGANTPSLPSAINIPPSSAPHVTVARSAANPAASSGPRPNAGPTRISSGISAGLLLAPIRPDYPAIARLTHTEGTVVVQAVISSSGAIESAQIISGPAVLQQAALDAVLKARYRPYLLNGQPTTVQTTFTIHFRMGS